MSAFCKRTKHHDAVLRRDSIICEWHELSMPLTAFIGYLLVYSAQFWTLNINENGAHGKTRSEQIEWFGMLDCFVGREGKQQPSSMQKLTVNEIICSPFSQCICKATAKSGNCEIKCKKQDPRLTLGKTLSTVRQ